MSWVTHSLEIYTLWVKCRGGLWPGNIYIYTKAQCIQWYLSTPEALEASTGFFVYTGVRVGSEHLLFLPVQRLFLVVWKIISFCPLLYNLSGADHPSLGAGHMIQFSQSHSVLVPWPQWLVLGWACDLSQPVRICLGTSVGRIGREALATAWRWSAREGS